MGNPVYDSAEHRAERRRLKPSVEAGEAHCTEIVCLMPSRWIKPGTAWHLAHDRRVHTDEPHRCTSACYLGPSHELCNTTEGGKWRHLKAKPARWVL